MSNKASSAVGNGLAKVLGIKKTYRDPLGAGADPVTRGESTFSVGTAETVSYLESEPTSGDWIKENTPSLRDVAFYFLDIFPFWRWITRYNWEWFLGDLIAGVTVGGVVVPQSMSYAELAHLPVQFGLYSSFMGVLIYWIFATSKDITIGPVAVMSTFVGTIVHEAKTVDPSIPGYVVASALAIISGAIIAAMGFLRLGFIVDFIPLPAISAFMTGAAVNIISGQVSKLLGETADFSTYGPTYQTIIWTLKYLPTSTIDASLGFTALFMLYLIRWACNYGARTMPHRAKLFFFLSTLRTVFVILFYIMVSAAVNLHRKSDPMFSVIGTVPRGFQNAGVPILNAQIIKLFTSRLPASVVILLIEHIAISKSFGRVNNYSINPSQEMIAIGATNLLGPFLGAYPATGSFSRTAIKSKAGVRTPFAGVITAIVVLLAIYALTELFWYIPEAALGAVIIHAVGDLITPPNVVYQFWRVSPFDAIIFFIGVIVSIFTKIEDGVYTTVCLSLAVFLFRVAKARGQFLGRVTIHSVVGDHLIDNDGKYGSGAFPESSEERNDHVRSVFLPTTHADGSNPDIKLDQPYPGVFIYRFSEGFNYPNANHYTDYLVEEIFKHTRRTNLATFSKPGDRPWNDPGPRKGKEEEDRSHLPTLRAVVLDMSSVNHVDTSSVQNLIDVRNQLDLYASPDSVQWHFAHINNRWTKRALAAAGFGYPTPVSPDGGFHRWKPIFSVAEIEGDASAAAHAEMMKNRRDHSRHGKIEDPEEGISQAEITETEVPKGEASSDDTTTNGKDFQSLANSKTYRARSKVAVVHGINRPFFHIDLMSALQSAVANTGVQEEIVKTGGMKE